MRYCVDCAHFIREMDVPTEQDQIRYGKCARTQRPDAAAQMTETLQYLSPVFPAPKPLPDYASIARSSGGSCRPNGEMYEAIPVQAPAFIEERKV